MCVVTHIIWYFSLCLVYFHQPVALQVRFMSQSSSFLLPILCDFFYWMPQLLCLFTHWVITRFFYVSWGLDTVSCETSCLWRAESHGSSGCANIETENSYKFSFLACSFLCSFVVISHNMILTCMYVPLWAWCTFPDNTWNRSDFCITVVSIVCCLFWCFVWKKSLFSTLTFCK